MKRNSGLDRQVAGELAGATDAGIELDQAGLDHCSRSQRQWGSYRAQGLMRSGPLMGNGGVSLSLMGWSFWEGEPELSLAHQKFQVLIAECIRLSLN